VVVSHAVRPQDEEAFLEWQHRMTEAEKLAPGFGGSELFRPVPGVQDDWVAVYRFATADDLEHWLNSEARQQLLREGERFEDFQLRKFTTSFGSWFTLDDGGQPGGPPSWKTALSVLVGLYPTVVLLTLAISELWKSGPLWASLLLGNIVSVALLTWVVMPVVTRALRFWLAPETGAAQPRTDLLGMLASWAFLAAAALVFWLVTVRLWTLP
jgi:antibiotic biosynthesis monooxygenase (ABM) superfamily enzyme